MVELARTGRTPASLAKEFGPTPWTISPVDQAGRPQRRQGRWRLDERGARGAHATARENRKLKEEREILSKAAAWFATEGATSKRSSGS